MNLDFGMIFAFLDYVTQIIRKYTELLFGYKPADGNTEGQSSAHLDNPAQDSP